MSFDPSAKYTKDELVRLARLFGIPLTQDGRAKPRERLMSNLSVRSKTTRPSGTLATTFNPNGPMKYSLENLRMFAKERGILATVDGRRKSKEELLTHLIMAAKGMKLPSGAARKSASKEPKAKKTQTKKAPANRIRKSVERAASIPLNIPRLPEIRANMADVVQMPNAEPATQSRAEKRKAARASARAAAREAAMNRLP